MPPVSPAAALGQLTGLPEAILDDRRTLDIDSVRGFFERRVLGQSEAVDCLVERVAMIKAGLARAVEAVGDPRGESLGIVRRYREEPSPLVRDSARGWRSGRIEEVLDGNFDLMG